MADVVAQLIAEAAVCALAPLGLRRRGRSRLWIDDRGWWLINVEFQPSSGRKGCYLNVGHQHLWVRRDHLVFDDPERPLGSSEFVSFDGDEEEFSHRVNRAASLAAEAVGRRRGVHGEGLAALEGIATSGDDLDGGIALAMLGRTAEAAGRLNGDVHAAYEDQADLYRSIDRAEAEQVARAAVSRCRQLLRLAEVWTDWRT